MPLITSANAADLNKKAQAARLATKLRAAERERLLAKLSERLTEIECAGPDYEQQRLMRVRKQIESVNQELEKSMDNPKALKDLTDALSRLCDLEQRYAMRPGPGTLRPTSRQAKSKPGLVEPID